MAPPGLNMRAMRLLDRYLLRELLVPLAYCLGGFLIFYVAFDLIFGIKGFQEKHLNFGDIAEYYAVTLPELLVTVVIPGAAGGGPGQVDLATPRTESGGPGLDRETEFSQRGGGPRLVH